MGSSVILPAAGQPTEGPDPNFKQGAIPNLVSFEFEAIDPPGSVYIQRDDVLIVEASTTIPNEQIFVNGRLLLPTAPQAGQPDTKDSTLTVERMRGPGTIVPLQRVFTITTPRASNFFTVPLLEGYLLAISIVGFTAQTRGQTYVRVGLARGTASGQNTYQLLFADYVTGLHSASWPGGRQQFPTEGPGFTRSTNVVNPAAGTDFSLTMLAGQRERIISSAALFTASATVANRQVEIIVDDGANIVWRTSLASNITASQVVTVSLTTTNAPPGVILTDLSAVIPPTLILQPLWRLRTLTTGIQVGDQWSAIWFNIEEWMENV